MTSKRKAIKAMQAWQADTRARACDHARTLAVAITSGTAQAGPAYDLGIVLQPGERVWHRCPAIYHWRGTISWIEQRTSYGGHRATAEEVAVPRMYSMALTDWLITDQRLATRTPTGEVVSIYWTSITGLTVDLQTGRVILDGPGGYHGEFHGPATAPIGVAAIAACHGARALLDHPALVLLRTQLTTGACTRSRRAALQNASHAPGDEMISGL